MPLFKSIDDMKRSMDLLLAECTSLRDAGQKEYAGGENAFGNFIRLGEQLDLLPEKVLWVYLTKHLDGIRSYLNGHHSQREPVRGRIKDAIVYLSLLAGMAETREDQLEEIRAGSRP